MHGARKRRGRAGITRAARPGAVSRPCRARCAQARSAAHHAAGIGHRAAVARPRETARSGGDCPARARSTEPPVHRVPGRTFHGTGAVSARQHRALRSGFGGLRPFHLADSALPDLMIHRALRARLGALPTTSLPSGPELVTQGSDLSRLERRSDEADRYVATFLKCVYLRDRVGQTFDGLITTVTEFGCFVQ